MPTEDLRKKKLTTCVYNSIFKYHYIVIDL